MFGLATRYMVLATFFFALMNVSVKILAHLPPAEVAFYRSIVSLSLSYGLIRYSGLRLPGKNIRTLLLRGLFGSSSLLLYFITLQRMPLASAVTLQFLSPIFTTVLGIFLVKEKVKPLQWLFFAMAFAGVLVIQGFDYRVSPGDVLIGFAASVFSGLAYNTIRKLRDSEHPFIIVFYFPFVSLPITGGLTFFHYVPPRGWDWFFLILIGCMAQIAQYFMTRAYQVDDLSKVSSLKYLGVIYALVFGYLFFDEKFTWHVYLGIFIVLAGVVLNLGYKHYYVKSRG